MPIKNVGADIKIFQGGDGMAMRRNLVVFDARKLWTFLEWEGGGDLDTPGMLIKSRGCT